MQKSKSLLKRRGFFYGYQIVCELCFMRFTLLMLLVFTLCLTGCNNHDQIERSFYYWQSNFSLSDDMQQALKDAEVTKLYVKFFDITWNHETAQPVPVADISFSSLVPAQTKIVPVVFITNQTLENIDTTATKLLAFKISKRIQGIITTNQLPTPEEIQIDCDWTGGTREKYFLLLTELQKFPLFQNTIWSATIRLHQVKFMENTGIPPVDRGMLMFYNMGNIEDINTPNSIYDKNTAAQYTERIEEYPLPLDAAIACYSWGLLFDGNELIKIFYPLYAEEILPSDFIKKQEGLYIAKRNFYFEGQFFVEGNTLKLETINPDLATTAAKQLSGELNDENRSVILYHLDASIINQYSYENIENIYRAFN